MKASSGPISQAATRADLLRGAAAGVQGSAAGVCCRGVLRPRRQRRPETMGIMAASLYTGGYLALKPDGNLEIHSWIPLLAYSAIAASARSGRLEDPGHRPGDVSADRAAWAGRLRGRRRSAVRVVRLNRLGDVQGDESRRGSPPRCPAKTSPHSPSASYRTSRPRAPDVSHAPQVSTKLPPGRTPGGDATSPSSAGCGVTTATGCARPVGGLRGRSPRCPQALSYVAIAGAPSRSALGQCGLGAMWAWAPARKCRPIQ